MNRSLFARLASVAALALAASSLVACSPEYDRTEISSVRGNNVVGGNVDVQKLTLPEGLVLTARVVVWNDDDETMPIHLRSKDTSIVEIAGVADYKSYAFLGLKEGQTEIEVLADGKVVHRIPATVTKQPAP